MGIDPLTHKLLPPPPAAEQPLPPPPPPAAEQPPPPEEQNRTEDLADIPAVDEPISTKDCDDQVKFIEELVDSDFCVDEIPVIEPHEILLSCEDNPSTSTSSSSSSSSMNLLEELQFSPGFDDYCSELMNNMWFDDLGGLDLMMMNCDSDDHHQVQYPIMVADDQIQECWDFWVNVLIKLNIYIPCKFVIPIDFLVIE